MDIIERFISYTQINTTTDREKGPGVSCHRHRAN